MSNRIPSFGVGTFRLTGPTVIDSVHTALELGYRAVDTAQIYGNEADVGQAIAQSGVPRADLFLTTKIWMENYARDKLVSSLRESLDKLRTDRWTGQVLKDRLAKNEESGLESMRQLRLLASTWDGLPLADKLQRLEEADAEITVSLDKIVLSANPEGIIERRIHTLTKPTRQKKPNLITRTTQASLHILHGEKKIVEPDDQAQTKELEHQREQLLRRIAQGRAWANELIEGKVESPRILAQREKKSESYIYDVLRAGCLSPGIVDQVIEGEGPMIGLDSLMAPIAISWNVHSQLVTNVRR